MDVLKATRTCYDKQAKQFIQTRKKHWPALPMIINALPEERPLQVADIGCGWGRLYESLVEHIGDKQLDYIGVDNAPWMITEAKKQYPEATFHLTTMLDYLAGVEQESLDAIVWLASLQHIHGWRERQVHLHHIYKALRYWGRCILVNRSFSNWFLQTYMKQILTWVGRSLVRSDRHWNDYLIPRKSPRGKKAYTRYYHIFTLTELKKLARMSWFVIKQAGYTSSDTTLSHDWQTARNTFLVLEKTVSDE